MFKAHFINMPEENKIRDAADAIKGIVEAVPIYQDAVQPAAKEVGTALQTVSKTIHIALAPISALVWGYDKIKDFVSTKVAEKLKDVPPENITTPKPNVAGPILESLKYTGHEESLRDLYANLLAASMDNRTAQGAHPAFAEIIRQLLPDEAKILSLIAQPRALPVVSVRWEYKNPTDAKSGGIEVLRNFSLIGYESNCEYPQDISKYIDNLVRLGLVEVPMMFQYTAQGVYDKLEAHPVVQEKKKYIEQNPEWVYQLNKSGIKVTDLGRQFCQVCVMNHQSKGLVKKKPYSTGGLNVIPEASSLI